MTNNGFLLMPRSLGLWQSVATLVASAAGVWILFSPAEAVSWSGISGLIGYALGQAMPLIIISFLGLRLLRTLPQGHTLPQWANSRYGAVMRATSILICIFYMTVFLTAELTAIGKATELITDTSPSVAVIVIAFLTWTYTNRGGFKMVVWTDIAQFAVMIPLLIIIFFYFILPLPQPLNSLLENIAAKEPQLLSIKHAPGIEFGITLIIAITGAQVFNQGLWQRAYSCRNEKIMSRSFFIAGIIMIPLVFITGLLGLIARNKGLGINNPESAIFELILNYSPLSVTVIFGILALFLVMSSMDTLINALSGLVVEELSLYKNHFNIDKKTKYIITLNGGDKETPIKIKQARVLTGIFTVTAALVATQGYSVLYLFLLADLICAATAFPLFFGLYSQRLSQNGSFISLLLGIACGVIFMLRPDFTPLINNPVGSSWLLSFSAAALISAASTLIFAYVFGRSKQAANLSG